MPELLLHSCEYDDRVDTWGLGCIMADLLSDTGVSTYDGESDIEIMAKVFGIVDGGIKGDADTQGRGSCARDGRLDGVAHVVLGLAMAAFALYAVALNPADLQPQLPQVLVTAFGRGMARLLALFVHALGGFNAYALYYAVRGVAAVNVGFCMSNEHRVTLVLYHDVFLCAV
ncbi:hypothetical protein ZWY2020_003462 [Hordeum vulgare]|nr:hypothetical protein ZWY2020_003462 [Hordeum vulgare]